MKEIWKDIKGYEGKYQISNMGNVKSLAYHRSRKCKILIPRDAKGYLLVNLCLGGKVSYVKIHRLVAEHFIPNQQNKAYVNHKDGNKHNNVVSNLEWATPLENNLHAYHILGKHPMRGYKFDKNLKSKKVEQHYISPEGYDYCIATYASAKVAALINKLNQSSISACCRKNGMYKEVGGYIWKYVSD